MDRLEREHPIVEGVLTPTEFEIQGIDVVNSQATPHAAVGGELSLSGFIVSDIWGLGRLAAFWTERAGEDPVSTTLPASVGHPPAVLMLLIHGEVDEGEKGVLHTEVVEIRPRAEGEEGWEFRCRTTAPDRPGEYAIDLQLMGAEIPASVADANPEYTAMTVFPIARSLLVVE